MRPLNNKALAVGAVIVAAIFICQLQSYFIPHVDTISTETDGRNVTYTVDATSDISFSEIHLSNGFDTPDRYYLLKDDSYPMMRDQGKFMSMLYLFEKEAARCPGITIKTVDAEGMLEIINNSLNTHTFRFGLIFMTGAIPDILYDGTSSGKLIRWTSEGGCTYWLGEPFGKYISTHDGIREVQDYHTSVSLSLFGQEHMFNDSDNNVFAKEKVSPELSDVAKVLCNETTYGMRGDHEPSKTLLLGYTDGTYASCAVTKYGHGMLTVFGSSAGSQYTYYLAHLLSLRITYSTELIGVETGAVNGSITRTFENTPGTSHFVMLHDLRVSDIWTYDDAKGRFV